MAVVKVNNYSDVVGAAQTGHLIVWTGKERINEVLNRAAEEARKQGFSPNVLTSIKICKEINFKKKAVLRTREGQTYTVEKLSEILEKKGKLTSQDMVIIKSNDLSEVLETVQQFINLGMFPDVFSEDEIVKRKIVENFFRIKGKLRKGISEIQKALEDKKRKIRSLEDLKESAKEDLLSSIQNFQKITKKIQEKLKEADDNTIKVAVFATKKSGKSMVVNALLGEEYAPTSVELATPNIVAYEPHEGKDIKLIYDGRERSFKKAEEVKKFIYKEFNEVNVEGRALPKMIIKYPKKEGLNFKIYDTPGPDLFKSEHAQLLDEIIEDTDIAIFVVDYGKYAQTSEMELFEKVKGAFEKKEKNFSLICAINKLDLMFMDTNVEKIPVRVGDFVKEKLESFGYKDFIVIPITAIMAFYAQKLKGYYEDIEKVDDIKFFLYQKFPEVFSSNDENLKTYLNTLFPFSNYLKDDNSSFEDLMELTGFQIFRKYLFYLSQNKAQLEKLWEPIATIDTDMTRIINETKNFLILLSEAEEIKKYLEEFQIDNEKERIEEFFGSIKKKFETKLSRYEKNLVDIEPLLSKIDERKNQIFFELEDDFAYLELGKMSKREFLNKYKGRAFLTSEDISGILENIPQLLEELTIDINKEFDKFQKDLEEEFKKIREELEQKINNLNVKLKKNYNLEINLKIPEVDFEIPKEYLKEKSGNLKGKIKKALERGNLKHTVERIEEYISGGIIESFIELFIPLSHKVNRGKIINTFEDNYYVIKGYLNDLPKRLSQALELGEFRTEVERKLDEVNENINNQFFSLREVLRNISEDVDKEREYRKKKAELLKSIYQKSEPIYSIWYENISKEYRKIKGEVKNV